MSDLRQFSQRMFGLSKRIEQNANLKVKDAAKAFLTTVVEMTPVDTGQAVSSWKVGLNYKPRGTRIFSEGTSGSTASANRSAVLAQELPKISARVTGQTISVVNTAPYIQRLNNGSSKKAPAGFIDSAYQSATIEVRKRRILG